MHSVWTETAELPRFGALEKSMDTDVLVIGGGVSGILSAHALQKAGVAYVLVEADRICGEDHFTARSDLSENAEALR